MRGSIILCLFLFVYLVVFRAILVHFFGSEWMGTRTRDDSYYALCVYRYEHELHDAVVHKLIKRPMDSFVCWSLRSVLPVFISCPFHCLFMFLSFCFFFIIIPIQYGETRSLLVWWWLWAITMYLFIHNGTIHYSLHTATHTLASTFQSVLRIAT